MKTTKLVQTAGRVWNVVIIPSCYGVDLKLYDDLFDVAKKDFPTISRDDVRCLRVVENIRYKGCAMLHFQIEHGTPIPADYHQAEMIEEMSKGSLL